MSNEIKSSFGWLELFNYATDPTDENVLRGGFAIIDSVPSYIVPGGSWTTLLDGGGGSTTFVALTDTPSNFTSAANKILKVNNAGNAVEFVTVSGDITIGATGTAAIAAGVIVNADVKSDAAIAYSKLNLTGAVLNADLAGSIGVGKIALTTGSLILGTASVGAVLDVSTNTAILIGSGSTAAMQTIGGDATMANDGTLSVSDLTIASQAAGDVIYYNGSNWIRLAKPGASDMYLEGGTTPQWSAVSAGIASNLAQNVTVEAGTNDYTLAFTTLTTGASTITFPDLAGAAATIAFINLAQTWTVNQTIEYGHLFLGDSDDGQTLQILVNENMTGDKTLTILPNDGSRSISLSGDLTISGDLITVGDDSVTLTTTAATDVTLPTTGTLATLAGAEAFTNKTLTLPKIATGGKIVDANGAEWIEFLEDATPVEHLLITQGDVGVGLGLTATSSDTNSGGLRLDAKGTGDIIIADGSELTFERGTENALFVIADQTGEAHTFNIPDLVTGASDTFAFLAEAQTLTNKSIDADNNTITNLGVAELESIADAEGGVVVTFKKTVANLAAAGTNIIGTHPKMQVIDVWFVATSADAGTIVVHQGQVGAILNAISNTITSTTTDKALIRTGGLDDDEWEVAEDAGLVAVGDGGASIDGVIFVKCVMID